MKNEFTILIISLMSFSLISCISKEDKVKETVQNYLYKNMKNPESLKILSCEVRSDTIPFYLTEEILDLADKCYNAMDEYLRYKDRSYLWDDEKSESYLNLFKAKESFQKEYERSKEDSPVEIETMAYVKSSGTNLMGGIVSNSFIFIIDKEDPTKILGIFRIDDDFIQKFVLIKMIGENYEFKTNKFGKYKTEGLPYLEQFIMNDAE